MLPAGGGRLIQGGEEQAGYLVWRRVGDEK